VQEISTLGSTKRHVLAKPMRHNVAPLAVLKHVVEDRTSCSSERCPGGHMIQTTVALAIVVGATASEGAARAEEGQGPAAARVRLDPRAQPRWAARSGRTSSSPPRTARRPRAVPPRAPISRR
jgi:hypothetical protein